MTHTEACNIARLIAAKYRVVLFRREVGLFYDRRGNERRLGVAGEADLQGWLPCGRAAAIEVKTGKAVRNKEQKLWANAFPGFYILARFPGGEEQLRTAFEAKGLRSCNQ